MPNQTPTESSLTVPTISAIEALQVWKAASERGQLVVGIDVRSEKEFTHGALPSFSNAPILNNDERHAVGITYKRAGAEVAQCLGYDLVGPLKNERVTQWTQMIEQGAELLICWRGGLRSKIAAEWIREAGYSIQRVEGGYQAIRRQLLVELEQPGQLRILAGRTGSGKTELLRQMAKCHFATLDLEFAAAHRGSSFGRAFDEKQPSQTSFENLIAATLLRTRGQPVWLEDESRHIGARVIPGSLAKAMSEAPSVLVEATDEERLARIHQEYVMEPMLKYGASLETVQKRLSDSLERISSKLGGLRTRELMHALGKAFRSADYSRAGIHAEWILGLLHDYYDPLYDYGITGRHAHREVLFRGNLTEVLQWLQTSNSPKP